MPDGEKPSLVKAATRAVVGSVPIVGPAFVAFIDYAFELDGVRMKEIDCVTGLDTWTAEDLRAKLQSDEQLTDVLREAVEGSRRTALREKRRALCRIARRLLDDDAEPDTEAAMVSALAAVEGPHIEFLRRMTARQDGQKLRNPMPIGAGDDLPQPYRAQLVGAGLIEQTVISGGSSSGGATTSAIAQYSVTAFGRQLLTELQQAADEEEMQ